MLDSEQVRTLLNKFTEQCGTFVKGVVAWWNLPTWDELWNEFTQEETHEEDLHGNQVKGESDEENISLLGHVRKGKGVSKLNKGE